MLTVTGLRAHPTWTDVAVLAGQEHTRTPVTGVELLRGFEGEMSQGALIVALDVTEVSDWRLDVLLRTAADAGASGIVLPVVTPLLHATRLLADRLGLVVLGSQRPLGELAVAARERLAAPDVARMRLVLSAQTTVSQRLRSPDELARVGADVLGVPVGVLDRAGSPIAGSSVLISDFQPHPPVPQRTVEGSRVRVAVPVLSAVGDSAEFWAAAVLEDPDADWEHTVRDVLTIVAAGVQRWHAVRRTELERDARLRTSLLGELLRLDGEPSAGLRRRLSEVGWRLDGWHVGVRIGGAEEMDVLTLTDEVHAALRAEEIQAEVVEGTDAWAAWITLDREPTQDQVGELVAALRRAQRRLDRVLTSHVGVGRAHGGASGIARSLAEAHDAAQLARNRYEVGRFLHIDRLGFAQLLLAWTRTDTFQPAARDLLAPLHGQPGDLVRTLTAYLNAESRLTETAAVLGVHRNTIATRIAKIEELLEVDLSNPDERLALHLACRTVSDAE